ncbi:hypothetical protein [Jannaschia sp. R86511]|uniref:hypothetical protein n=1 Tax=Jannaschia sp. R86511 TaxID=3093853 RepID=UPI0036D3AB9F
MEPSPATVTRPSRRRAPVRPAATVAAVLGTALLLGACSGDEVDPTDAETGPPVVESVPPDPAASPADSEDPLTGSEP